MKQQTPEQIVESLLEGKTTIDEAISNLVKDAGVKVGATVAVLGDPTWPFDGQKGVVRSLKEDGYADVEFPNGSVVPLQVSLLLVVN